MPVIDTRMRRIGRLLGWLSLFATLALLSPGVIATAHAEELSGPACPAAQEGDENTVVGIEQVMDQLRAEASERGDASGGVVTLNTRGFNYVNSAGPKPAEQPEGR